MTREEKSLKLYQKLMPLLQEGKTVEIHPDGSSMFPLITSPSDSVLLRIAEKNSLQSGDILLYQRSSGLLVLHRLCRIGNDGYYFAGDNQTEIEGPLQASQLIAVVTHICRKGHTFHVKNPIYRLYSRIWLILRPIRPVISRPLGKLWRMLHSQNT